MLINLHEFQSSTAWYQPRLGLGIKHRTRSRGQWIWCISQANDACLSLPTESIGMKIHRIQSQFILNLYFHWIEQFFAFKSPHRIILGVPTIDRIPVDSLENTYHHPDKRGMEPPTPKSDHHHNHWNADTFITMQMQSNFYYLSRSFSSSSISKHPNEWPPAKFRNCAVFIRFISPA